MNVAREDWMKLNQECLIAEINVLKTKLLVYKDSLNGEGNSDNNSQLLVQANAQLELVEKNSDNPTRLQTLIEIYQLSSFEKNVLLMGVGVELDASFGKLIAELQGGTGHEMPTFSLALSVFTDSHWSALSPEGPLRYWQLLELSKNAVLTSSSYSVDELILHYLTGISVMDGRLSPFVNIIKEMPVLVPSHQKIADQIIQYLARNSGVSYPPMVQLMGTSMEDKKAIVSNIFSAYNMPVYSMSVETLPSNFQELSRLIRLWNREAVLHQNILFIDGKHLSSHDKTKNKEVRYFLDNLRSIVIIGSDFRFIDMNKEIHSYTVEKPIREEQQILWRSQLGNIAETLDNEIGNLVTQFNLDSHTITYLAQQAAAGNNTNGSKVSQKPNFRESLWKSCCDHTRPDLSSLAQRIETFATWDDLVLPNSQKTVLEDICIHVKQRQKVYYDWGFRSKSNRGLGISALFAGESGTGKTMASEVIANTLNLDLYRIDLSQVVNKYIGETEKNLKKIFEAAEDSGAILLFDEADALFGKRSEVKDSHDRHSNIEVSYLLQKMEEYRGLAILTTNMKNALDKAFLRRIRFVIQFPFPDTQMRGEIWKRVFPKQTPTKDLSIQKLANLNVAGGNIRNIALNASFAAAHKDQAVTMLDIHNAARNEYVKLEKHMSPSESLI